MGTRLLLILLALLFLSGVANAQGKFSGYMFGDYAYNTARDSGVAGLSNVATGGPKDFQAFQLRRIYFTYDNDISSRFTARFRLEADQVSNTTDGKIGVQVKDAYLRWKNIFPGSELLFGIHPTPAYETSEAFWNYRSLEKTIMDLRGIVPSRDLGVSLRGKIDAAGVLNYWVMAANGNANRPENDKYKRYYGQVQLKPWANTTLTLYGDYADRAKAASPFRPVGETVSRGVFTMALFAGYAVPDSFGFGVEGFLQHDAHGYSTGRDLDTRKGAGLSLFAWYYFVPEFGVVGRFDRYDPNSDSRAEGDVRNYFIGSLVYRPEKNVMIMPNALVETYQSRPGTRDIGSSVTARVTLYYIFL